MDFANTIFILDRIGLEVLVKKTLMVKWRMSITGVNVSVIFKLYNVTKHDFQIVSFLFLKMLLNLLAFSQSVVHKKMKFSAHSETLVRNAVKS